MSPVHPQRPDNRNPLDSKPRAGGGGPTPGWAATTSAPLPKFLLTLPSKVPHQPVGVEGVLGGHAPAHDGVQKGLPLPGVEAQHLGRRAGGGGAENSGMGREAYGGRSWGEAQRTQDPETQGSVLAPPLLGRDPGQAPHLPASIPTPHPQWSSRDELFVLRRGKGGWESGVQTGPTSILPPTRARRGGRGLSLSLFSCLLDCRRPPGKQTHHDLTGAGGVPAPQIPSRSSPQDSRTPQDILQRRTAVLVSPGHPRLTSSPLTHVWAPVQGHQSRDSLCPSGLSSKSSSSSSEPMEYSDWLSESSSCHSVRGHVQGTE